MAELWIRGHVIEQFGALRGRPWEVGGWLLGYRDTGAIVITHATPPMSRGTPFGVTINGRGHRPAFDRIWDATEGRVTFLGDWHTHPGGPALPSQRDQDAVTQIAQNADFKGPESVIGILATPRLPRRASATVASFEADATGTLKLLNLRVFDRLPGAALAPEPWPAR